MEGPEIIHGFSKWLGNHWAELLTALGVGGTGAYGAKKLTDKDQDRRIKVNAQKISDLSEKVDGNTKGISDIKSGLEINTKFDKQLREEIDRRFKGLEEGQIRLDSKMDRVTDHIIQLKSGT